MNQTTPTTPADTLTLVLIDDCDLAVAGLGAILAPYADRVTLVDPRTALAHPEDLDVILYEPVGLSAMGASMLRDLQRLGEARTAVFSWVAAAELPTPTVQPHLGKRLTASQIVRAVEELVEGRYHASATSTRAEVVAAESEVEVEVEVDPEPARAPLRVLETPLTPRERDVITLVTGGRSNIEISEELAVSINSVKTYIRSAYRKMGVTRRSQAVFWGLTNGYDRLSTPAASAASAAPATSATS